MSPVSFFGVRRTVVRTYRCKFGEGFLIDIKSCFYKIAD